MLRTSTQLRHVLKLYEDDDPEIKELIRNILVRNSQGFIFDGIQVRKQLKRELRPGYDRMLSEIHNDLVLNAFKQQFQTHLEDLDLEKSVMLLAYWNNPAVNIHQLYEKLNLWTQEVREYFSAVDTPETIMERLNHYLFQVQGVTGNAEDYYDPKNSFLDCILDTRVGIPISLSVLYMLIARRIGLTVYGIPLPAHFIIKLEDGTREYFIDPFYSGTQYSRQECQNYIISNPQTDPEKILKGCTNYEIVIRMMKNLELVYSSYLDEEEKALQMSTLIKLVEDFYL